MNEDHYKKIAEQQRAIIEAMGFSQPTLRDQFAMAALTGLIASADLEAELHHFALDAYAIADAMLEARK